MSNYQTFSQYSALLQQKQRTTSLLAGGCLTLIVLVIVTAFCALDIAAIMIAKQNLNATCYADKYNLSLAAWLIFNSSGSIICYFIMICCMLLVITGVFRESTLGMTITGTIIIYYIFSFAMLIMGIIELAYQFEACKTEAKVVDIFVVLFVVLKGLSLCGGNQLRSSSD